MGWGKESPLPGKEYLLVGEEITGITLTYILSPDVRTGQEKD